MRRLLVAGGGTGGHVYPLLAVVEALREQAPETEIRYLGRQGSIEERLARREGLEFHPVAAGAVRGKGLLRGAVSLIRVGSGVGVAYREMRRFRPEAVLVTGGYVSVPVAVAARLAGRPLVVCLPDMEPGLAVRVLARLAHTVTVSFDQVSATLPRGKAVVTGYPVRAAFYHGDRHAARLRLGLHPEERVVVVFGGSSGARSLNEAVLATLPDLLKVATLLHITGPLDYERVRTRSEGLATCAQREYRIYSYVEQEMADLLWAADLVVARAGAATLGEFPAVGVPSLLVPGTYAGGHQARNAAYLQQQGAAVVIPDDELASHLATRVTELLLDSARLAAMAAAARRLARPGACRAIVAELQRAAGCFPV